MHLDALALAADQTGLAEDFEVLRQSRPGYGLVVDIGEGRTVVGTVLAHDVGVDRHAHGIGQGMKDRFNRNVLYRGMEQRPH